MTADQSPLESNNSFSSPAYSDRTQENSSGPVVGIVIIIVLLILGAGYFWSTHRGQQNEENTLPLIPGDSATTTTP